MNRAANLKENAPEERHWMCSESRLANKLEEKSDDFFLIFKNFNSIFSWFLRLPSLPLFKKNFFSSNFFELGKLRIPLDK